MNNVSSTSLTANDIIGLTADAGNQIAPYSSILSFNNDVGVVSKNSTNELTFNGVSYGGTSTLFTLSGDDDITFDVKNDYGYGNFYTGSGDDVIRIINEVGSYNRTSNLTAQGGSGNDELFGIVWPSQFSFFSIIDGEGLKLQANNATCIVEYAYYTKA